MDLQREFRTARFEVSCLPYGLASGKPKHPRWVYLINDAYDYVALRDRNSEMAKLLKQFLDDYVDAHPSYKLEHNW